MPLSSYVALLFGEAVRLQDISIVGLIGAASETTEEARGAGRGR